MKQICLKQIVLKFKNVFYCIHVRVVIIDNIITILLSLEISFYLIFVIIH